MSDTKVALMTGTGQGIGKGFAIEMAKAGYMAVSSVWPV
jgi:NAD(P)-dependent dehydrogenase (short-subunit alcohol dehydrogenase family)